ncbi:MAG: leucine-rich repeat protein [Bacteroidales bacterium]|nr:leucine-rich repeat protein [Bacteroidales bacterium]
MKTIVRLCVLFLALALSSACVREEHVEYAAVELTARMEYETDTDTDTKTTLSGLENGMYYPLWSAGDEIAVFVDGASEPSKFTLQFGEGSTVASFSGTVKGDEYVAIYPYDMAGSMSDGKVSLTLPQTQTYVPDSFGQGSFPMIATGGSDGSLKFMNLCSVLKISLTGRAAIRSITVSANDKDTYLSGPALVNAAASMDYLTMTEGASNTVVLECKGAKIEETPDFHIVIPSQTYKRGLTLEIDAYTDTITKVIDADLVFERSQIRTVKGLELATDVPAIIPEAIPDDEIWYITSDNDVLRHPLSDAFDQRVISNTYSDGKGVIKLSGKLHTIKSFAFSNSWQLKYLVLPESVETLEDQAFFGLDLDSLYVSSNLSNFTGYAFSACKIGRFVGDSIVQGNGRFIITGDTLKAVATLQEKELVIPGSIRVIGRHAIWSVNPNVTKILIEEGVEIIEPYAFSGCKSLEEVYLPNSLIDLQNSVFDYCDNIRQFYGPEEYVSNDGRFTYRNVFWIDKEEKFISNVAKAGLTEFIVDDDIGGLDPESFCRAYDLKTLTINSQNVYISGDTFDECYNLECIKGPGATADGRGYVGIGFPSILPDSSENLKFLIFAGKGISEYEVGDYCQEIGSCVFAYQPDLKKVKFDDSIIRLGSDVFRECQKLEEVTLPAQLKYIGINAFTACPNIKSVYLRSILPPELERYGTNVDDIFDEVGRLGDLKIYVPESSVSLYKDTFPWSLYSNHIVGYQPDYDYYVSSDYSSDGVVETLQTATKGNGIKIVLLGDGYSDRQIADGTYKADMEFAYRNLFTEEPYKSHQDMFNVSYVNVVSMTEGYEYGGNALGCQFGGGTYVYGNDALCFKYAQNAVAEEDMDEALVVVLMNSDAYAGTCFMYHPIGTTKDYGSGAAVAYFPKGTDEDMFAQLLHHEANGHGFAKLADEYAYEDMGEIPSSVADDHRRQQNDWGWWKNVDFTSDVTQVRWANFIEDERYANEGLGAYEGGLTYWSGVWRPTENSIMRYNTGGFNAPSREAIYYRIHKLAYGEDWEYDYEKFVEYDAINRAAAAGGPQKRRANYVEKQYEPLHPPVVVGKTWREAGSN